MTRWKQSLELSVSYTTLIGLFEFPFLRNGLTYLILQTPQFLIQILELHVFLLFYVHLRSILHADVYLKLFSGVSLRSELEIV